MRQGEIGQRLGAHVLGKERGKKHTYQHSTQLLRYYHSIVIRIKLFRPLEKGWKGNVNVFSPAKKLKWPRFSYFRTFAVAYIKETEVSRCWGRLGIELWRRTWRETKEARNHNYFGWKFFSVLFDFCATLTAGTCDWLLLFLNRITCESCQDLSWSGPRS